MFYFAPIFRVKPVTTQIFLLIAERGSIVLDIIQEFFCSVMANDMSIVNGRDGWEGKQGGFGYVGPGLSAGCELV